MKKLILTSLSLISAIFLNGQIQTFQWVKATELNPYGPLFVNAVDQSGNAYGAGIFKGTVDFDPGAGVFNLTAQGNMWGDIFILKLDPIGNFIWAKQIGGVSYEHCNSIILDDYGNIYMAGTFSETVDFDPNSGVFNLSTKGIHDEDAFVLKLDPNGNFLWVKNMGGYSNDNAFGISLDKNGNIYTTGRFANTADFDPSLNDYNLTSAGDYDAFILKLDALGKLVWAKKIGGSGYDSGNKIKIDPMGNIYTIGGFLGTSDFDPGSGIFNLTSVGSQSNSFLSKLNESGNFVWAVNLGTYSAEAMTVDPLGNVYPIGIYRGTVDMDPGIGTFNLTSAGPAGTNDIVISKLNSSGNFIWAKSIGGANNDRGYSITIDGTGNIYATGYFALTTDFDPNAGTHNITSYGGIDIFILKLDSQGNLVWVKTMGGPSNESGNSIVIDNLENIYIVGDFVDTVDFDPDSASFYLTPSSKSIFIHKMSKFGLGIDKYSITGNLAIYPNPTAGVFSIVCNGQDLSHIEIYNSLGTLVYKRTFITETNTIDLANHPNGIYFIKLIDDENKISTARIIKTN